MSEMPTPFAEHVVNTVPDDHNTEGLVRDLPHAFGITAPIAVELEK